MHWALRDLHMAPHQFWRSTLRELAPAPGSPPGGALRQSLNDLMALWPDGDGR